MRSVFLIAGANMLALPARFHSFSSLGEVRQRQRSHKPPCNDRKMKTSALTHGDERFFGGGRRSIAGTVVALTF